VEEVKMGIFIQRKTKDGKEVVQVVPREAVVLVELLGDRLVITTTRTAPYTDLEIQLKPEQVGDVKAQLLNFAVGKVIWIVEE
jgi:preprotein translocase subunit Sec63